MDDPTEINSVYWSYGLHSFFTFDTNCKSLFYEKITLKLRGS